MKFLTSLLRCQRLPYKGLLGPKATNCALPPGPPRTQTPLTVGPDTCHSLYLPASPSGLPWSCLFPIVCSFRVSPFPHSAAKVAATTAAWCMAVAALSPLGTWSRDQRWERFTSDGPEQCLRGEETFQCRKAMLAFHLIALVRMRKLAPSFPSIPCLINLGYQRIQNNFPLSPMVEGKPQQLGYFSEKMFWKANGTMCSFLVSGSS